MVKSNSNRFEVANREWKWRWQNENPRNENENHKWNGTFPNEIRWLRAISCSQVHCKSTDCTLLKWNWQGKWRDFHEQSKIQPFNLSDFKVYIRYLCACVYPLLQGEYVPFSSIVFELMNNAIVVYWI